MGSRITETRRMAGKQHRNQVPHDEDEWCLPMRCNPIRMTGLESMTVQDNHRGLHDNKGSWCVFYGCEPLMEDHND